MFYCSYQAQICQRKYSSVEFDQNLWLKTRSVGPDWTRGGTRFSNCRKKPFHSWGSASIASQIPTLSVQSSQGSNHFDKQRGWTIVSQKKIREKTFVASSWWNWKVARNFLGEGGGFEFGIFRSQNVDKWRPRHTSNERAMFYLTKELPFLWTGWHAQRRAQHQLRPESKRPPGSTHRTKSMANQKRKYHQPCCVGPWTCFCALT